MSATLARCAGSLSSARSAADRSGSGTDSGISGLTPFTHTANMTCAMACPANGSRPVARCDSVAAAEYASDRGVISFVGSYCSGLIYPNVPQASCRVVLRVWRCRRRAMMRHSIASPHMDGAMPLSASITPLRHDVLPHRHGRPLLRYLGQAEVPQQHCAAPVQQQVVRLDIAVHQPRAVQAFQPLQHLLRHVHQLPDRQPRPQLPQPPGE